MGVVHNKAFDSRSGTFVVTVDQKDADLLCESISKKSNGKYFKIYVFSGKASRPLGRVILERKLGRILSSSEFTDHKDRNPLNNVRENLRLASRSENNRNQGKRTGRAYQSNYKGVRKSGSGWSADIQVNEKRFHLGTFESEIEAKAAYVGASIVAHGEFACSH